MPDEIAPTGDGIVQVAYLHSEHVSHSWHESMRALLEYDGQQDHRIARKPLNLRCGSAIVSHVRNYAARLFLDKTPHEWMLFIDTDMGFRADAVDQLLAAADPTERPVMGALCFAAMEAAYDGMGGWRRTIVATMYSLGRKSDDAEPSFCHYGPYPEDSVVPVAGTGGAFLLMHRSALEKVRAEVGDHWFDMFYDRQGDIVGEDIAFCGRLLRAGITPHVHTGVKTTHHKEVWLSEQDYVLQEAVVLQPYPDLPLVIDLEATFAALAAGEHVHDGMLKLRPDLARYEQIIAVTHPEVIVECGTHTGASARWFFDRPGVKEVITIDLNTPEDTAEVATDKGRVTYLSGGSTDAEMVSGVASLVGERRCMVVLDSDHSAAHVAAEIAAYGPLVSANCYLVVEDTVYGYGTEAKARDGMAHLVGSPLDAVAKLLVNTKEWSRDIVIERTDPVSSNPAGWWVRNA